MKISEIVELLTNAIPVTDSWTLHEAYGAYNIKDFNKEVNKILYCVTPTHDVVEYFYEHTYDLLISHHPYVEGVPQLIFHTALDCCKNGLNDMWSNYLNVKNPKHFSRNLGWHGEIDPLSFNNLLAKIEEFIGHSVVGVKYNKNQKPIQSVVICTGLGGMVLTEAEFTKADCYITGELMGGIQNSRFKAVIEVGHTLSEFIGVSLFQRLLPSLQIDSAPLEVDYFGCETSIGTRGKIVTSSPA